MQLIKRQDRQQSIARDLFGEIRDLGVRLEHLASRYERLVRDMDLAAAGETPEMQARVRMANRELSLVAIHLQALLVEQHEAARRGYRPRVPGAAVDLDDVSGVSFERLSNAASA